MIETASNQQADIDKSEDSPLCEAVVAKTEALAVIEAAQCQDTEANPNGFFADVSDSAQACSVRVALRTRPLIGYEKANPNAICVNTDEQANQVTIHDQIFTYDRTFGLASKQVDVFDVCVKNLVLGTFQGYNATVLAYGQTGSGKTFTMGTGFAIGVPEDDLGILPRVIKLIYDEVEVRKQHQYVIVKASFIEIYNEEIINLLDNNTQGPLKKEITIYEERNTIMLKNLADEVCESAEHLASLLDKGASSRNVASTNMNEQSSRSHGIFTITIEQYAREEDDLSETPDSQAKPDRSAKFHFVDLAGSERAKKTGAEGKTFKEGVNINMGLLALGNVISALTEETGKRNVHVRYRDSKLTRLLQDSLGGNSRTTMIACCSPAETNFAETLGTLQYASRARNIKNKPVINQDPDKQQIECLRQQVFLIQKELMMTRKTLVSNGITGFTQTIELPSEDVLMSAKGNAAAQAVLLPNPTGAPYAGSMLSGAELKKLESQIAELKAQLSGEQKSNRQLQAELDTIKMQHSDSQLEKESFQKERDLCRFQLEKVQDILKAKNLLLPVLQAINVGSTIESETKSLLEVTSSDKTLLEEYRITSESQKEENATKERKIQSQQAEIANLLEEVNTELKLLETKEIEIEQLKNRNNKLQRENAQILRDQKRPSTAGHVHPSRQSGNQPSQAKVGSVRSQVSRRRSTVQNSTKASQDNSEEWMPNKLDDQIKKFGEYKQKFLDDLSTGLVANLFNSVETRTEIDQQDIMMEGDSLTSQKILTVQSSDSDSDAIDELEETQPQTEDLEPIDTKEIQTARLEDENAINKLEGEVSAKEALLVEIKKVQAELQDNLLGEMKQRFDLQIQAITEKLRDQEKEKAILLKNAGRADDRKKIEEQYKRKEAELLARLKDYKQKDAAQQKLSKDLTKQKQNVTSLEVEIQKTKQQKVVLQKKMKDDAQFKKQQQNMMALLKKNNTKKDQEIAKLKREKQRTQTIAKRNKEEVYAMQKKEKVADQKKAAASKQRQSNKGVMDTGKIQEWIVENIDKMVDYHELQNQKIQAQKEVASIQSEIDQCVAAKAKQNIILQKLEHNKTKLTSPFQAQNEDHDIYQVTEEISKTENQINEIQRQIEQLEHMENFLQDKVSEFSGALIQQKPMTCDSMVFEKVNSLEGSKAFITCFFSLLLDANLTTRNIEAMQQSLQSELEVCEQKLTQMLEQLRYTEAHCEQEISIVKAQHSNKDTEVLKLIIRSFELDLDEVIHDYSKKVSEDPVYDSFEDALKNVDVLEVLESCLNVKAAKGGAVKPHEPFATNNANLKKARDARKEVKEINKGAYNQTKASVEKQLSETVKKLEASEKLLQRSKIDEKQAVEQGFKYQRKIQDQQVQNKKLEAQISIMNDPLQLQSQGHLKNKMPLAKAQTQPQSLKDRRNQFKAERIGLPQIENMDSLDQSEPENVLPGTAPTPPQKAGGNVVPESAAKKAIRNNNSLKVGNEGGDTNVFLRLGGKSRERTKAGNRPITPIQTCETTGRKNSPRFEKMKAGTPSIGPHLSFVHKQQQQQDSSVDSSDWEIVCHQKDAHDTGILAMTTVENRLFTSCRKQIKVWDLAKMLPISTLPENIGSVKSMTYWKEKNMLITAADKKIYLWDTVSLTNVGSLNTEKAPVKALEAVEGTQQLFAASKGLLIYDFRKLNSNMNYDIADKSLEIFSLTSQHDNLFMGCRDHNVYPYSLSQNGICDPVHPPHMDVVTSLAMLGGGTKLVSGSRDKHIRTYDLTGDPYNDSQLCKMNAHNDWITALESNASSNLLYSGCRDGSVKIWDDQLNVLERFPNNAGMSVNALCHLTNSTQEAFASGSNDRAIRIYRQKELPFQMGSIDYNVMDSEPADVVDESSWTDRQSMQINDSPHKKSMGGSIDISMETPLKASAMAGSALGLLQKRRTERRQKNIS